MYLNVTFIIIIISFEVLRRPSNDGDFHSFAADDGYFYRTQWIKNYARSPDTEQPCCSVGTYADKNCTKNNRFNIYDRQTIVGYTANTLTT